MRLGVFLCLLIMVSAVSGQDLSLYSLQIQIVDSLNDEPLDEVIVRCNPGNLLQKSDKQGRVRFNALKAGSYSLNFSHLGCPEANRQVKLEKSQSMLVKMSHQIYQLNEVQIQPKLTFQPVWNQIGKNEINEQAGASLAEMLAKIPGINLLQTGAGIQKPVINGLSDSRIVYVNKGSRLESQQWGQDHAPEIDPVQANRIRLVVPAKSFRMGADAIGGMVELLPAPFPNDGQHTVEIGSGFRSNNRQWNLHASVAGHESKWANFQWRMTFSGRKAGNTRTPDYWLYNTGFSDHTWSLETSLPLGKGRLEADVSFFQATSGIFLGSQIGNITDLVFAINQSKPTFNKDEFSYEVDRPRQEVNHRNARIRFLSASETQRHWQLQFNLQQNKRKEFDLARISDNPELDLALTSWQFYGEWHSGNGFSAGIATNYRQNIWSGSRFFIPNYEQLNPAFYLNWERKLNRFTLHSGARLDYQHLETYRNQNGILFSNQRNWWSASASFQLVKHNSFGTQHTVEASLLWRPPQVNELYVNGLHHGTSSFERGDADLKQEGGIRLSWQLDRRFWSGKVGIQQQLFSQYLPGFIYAKPDGQPMLTIRGAFPAFTFTQTNAWLNGGNWSAFFEPILALE